MIHKIGDLWEFRQPGDWVAITTNGFVRKDGCLVMGRGIALEAQKRYDWLPADLGDRIKNNGLQLEVIHGHSLIAFPVKRHFKDEADINLILKSTLQLIDAAQRIEGRILLPRLGCGFGRLDWVEVRPLMEHYFKDDRYIVFHKPAKRGTQF